MDNLSRLLPKEGQLLNEGQLEELKRNLDFLRVQQKEERQHNRDIRSEQFREFGMLLLIFGPAIGLFVIVVVIGLSEIGMIDLAHPEKWLAILTPLATNVIGTLQAYVGVKKIEK